MLHIVLVEPEIPQNTGNIARTCAATGCVLHLVEPLGFAIDDKRMKRAGLDYWHLLDVRMYKNLDEFFEKNPNGRYFYATTKAPHAYHEAESVSYTHLDVYKRQRRCWSPRYSSGRPRARGSHTRRRAAGPSQAAGPD